MKDHAEVCPLSRGMMLLATQSLSARLQGGLRFLRTPMPAPPTAFLAVSLPEWAAIRVFRVPPDSHGWFRSCLFTGSVPVRAAPWIRGGAPTVPIFAKAFSGL